MTCFSPLEGWRSRHPSSNGKFGLVFDRRESNGQRMQVACGQCIGCRTDRSKAWAVRCVHEASLHEENSFLTLTYRDEALPQFGGLQKSDHQKFMKRLRKRIAPGRVRFFHCGEYGENLSRPHYHTLLFGYDYPDKEFWKVGSNGDKLYRSDLLEEEWGLGHCLIGAVTFQSAAYVARYIMKKITGERASAHYRKLDPSTGELIVIEPEYITMSLKPALGSRWYGKFASDCYPSDFVVVDGKKQRIPKYYDCLLESENEELLVEVKEARKRRARSHKVDNTVDRLRDREKVAHARAALNSRQYEKE